MSDPFPFLRELLGASRNCYNRAPVIRALGTQQLVFPVVISLTASGNQASVDPRLQFLNSRGQRFSFPSTTELRMSQTLKKINSSQS